MEFDIKRVRDNIRKATTEDLLDRVTAFESSLEPEALTLIFEELNSRGVKPEDIVTHEKSQPELFLDENGLVRKCFHCYKPATEAGWGWHRLFGKVPIFPRYFYWCKAHAPKTDDQEIDTANNSDQ